MSEKLREHSRKAIHKGSKSFTAAGYLLGRENRDLAFMLYSWCRHCDDAIDELPKGECPLQAVRQLHSATERIYANRPVELNAFAALEEVNRQRKIPKHYPVELLAGMEMDISKHNYENMDELLLYCYRVAGVVGLMMAHIMGVNNEKALEHACHMGMAMQLTNIARDVMTDARMGRVYLPADLLNEVGLQAQPEVMLDLKNWPLIYRVVLKLLDRAEKHYEKGDEGIQFLSFRSGFAIVAARTIYSYIGELIRKRGPQCWEKRVFTSRRRKMSLILKALLKTLYIQRPRIFRGWSPVSIRKVLEFRPENLRLN